MDNTNTQQTATTRAGSPSSELFGALSEIEDKLDSALLTALGVRLPAYGEKNLTKIGCAPFSDMGRNIRYAKMAIADVRRTLELNGHAPNAEVSDQRGAGSLH
jgi:hypothetical protein